MADRSLSGSRKHKWSNPTEMSPNKYLKSNKSELCRRVSQSRNRYTESPSPPLERHITLYPHQSTPKHRPDSGSGSHSSARDRSRYSRSLRTNSLDFRESARAETSADVVPGKSRTLGEDHHLSKKDTPRVRTPRFHAPSILFKKAFSDILGTPSRARRSLTGETTNQEVQIGKKTSRPDQEEPTRRVSALNPNRPQEEPLAERSSEGKEDRLGRSHGPRRIVTELLPERGADVREEVPRLVFEDDSDKDADTADVRDDPSIGSDFSDVDDIGTLARFSQEDTAPPCCSVQEDHGGTSSSDYSHNESSWTRYSDLWPTSPNYRPPAEQNTWRQEAGNSSYISECSLKVADRSNLSAASDGESVMERNHQRSGSFDAPSICDLTTKSVRRTFQTSAESPKFLNDGFIDTHCHLDMLFSRLSHNSSFAELRKQYATTFPREFQGCITDYCDPRTLGNLPWEQVLNEDMVWGAFGCHPHFARYYNNRMHEAMMKALRHPKAIAFGEMGLDYSHKCSTDIPHQKVVFEKQLKVAVSLGKPLVIHCRNADHDLFQIMKKCVPWDYKIHRHCFTGSYKEIEPLLNQFPNLAVGFTAVLTYPSAVKAREAVTQIPLERLIVETDAPYFLPRQVPKRICKFSHPGVAFHTIQEIATLRNLPFKSVLSQLRENTRSIYNV